MRAIHDRYFATPPESHDAYRWRLQLLSEERFGTALRSDAAAEDAAFDRASGLL